MSGLLLPGTAGPGQVLSDYTASGAGGLGFAGKIPVCGAVLLGAAQGSGSFGEGLSGTFSIPGTGKIIALIGYYLASSQSGDVTGITINGKSASVVQQLAPQAGSNYVQAEIWELANPTPGNDVACSFTTSITGTFYTQVVLLQLNGNPTAGTPTDEYGGNGSSPTIQATTAASNTGIIGVSAVYSTGNLYVPDTVTGSPSKPLILGTYTGNGAGMSLGFLVQANPGAEAPWSAALASTSTVSGYASIGVPYT